MHILEKINTEIEKLYDADDKLIDLLAQAGRDSETAYPQTYHDMVEGIKALREGLHELLDKHNDVITDLEYECEPVPIKPNSHVEMATKVFGIERFR